MTIKGKPRSSAMTGDREKWTITDTRLVTKNRQVLTEIRDKYNTRDDLWDDPDASIIDIQLEDNTLRVINIYNQALEGREG